MLFHTCTERWKPYGTPATRTSLGIRPQNLKPVPTFSENEAVQIWGRARSPDRAPATCATQNPAPATDSRTFRVGLAFPGLVLERA